MAEAGRNTAVLLAGGIGARVGLTLPKQLIKVAGRPIMEHTLAVLDAHPDVEDIVVMMASGHLDAAHALVEAGGYTKVRHVLEGGETRSHTTLRALEVIGSDDTKVLTHDAVRALVSPRIVADCFRALDDHGAVDVAIPSTDTVIEIGEDNTVPGVLPRSTVRRGQTPQGFRAGVLRAAYARALADPEFEPADDCTVVHRYLPEVPIWVVAGEERNMKVTEPIDIYLAEKLFQLASRDRVRASTDEQGYRAALDGRTVVVLGGGYGVGADIARLARTYGAHVAVFGRSTSGTQVAQAEDVRAALEVVLREHGRVDHVVNTSGVVPRGSVVETSDETLYSTIEVNYLGPVHVARTFLPHLAETRGSLLFLTSSSYTRGRGGYGLHSSTSAAVVNLTQALAEEWGPREVRVNCAITPERADSPYGADPASGVEVEADADEVARAALDALLSAGSGQSIELPHAGTPVSG